ncbi:MAG: hypothetical protein ABR555_09540 [Pyrinomonadaceae bacterium]
MRNRRTHQLISVSLFLSLLLPSSVALAQNTRDWSNLLRVPPGTKLLVKLKTGKDIEGILSAAGDDALTLEVNNIRTIVKADEIKKVFDASKKSSANKPTLIGLAVGAGAGGAIGAAGSNNNDSFDKIDHAVTAGLVVIGAAAGALTGYLLGRGNQRKLIYESAK